MPERAIPNVWVLVFTLLVVWISYNVGKWKSAQSDIQEDIAKIKTILEHELTEDIGPLKKEIADIKGTLKAIRAWKNEILEIKTIIERELTEDIRPLKSELNEIKKILRAIREWKTVVVEIKNILQRELTEDIRDLKKHITDFSGAILDQLTRGKEEKGLLKKFPDLAAIACSVAEFFPNNYFRSMCIIAKTL